MAALGQSSFSAEVAALKQQIATLHLVGIQYCCGLDQRRKESRELQQFWNEFWRTEYHRQFPHAGVSSGFLCRRPDGPSDCTRIANTGGLASSNKLFAAEARAKQHSQDLQELFIGHCRHELQQHAVDEGYPPWVNKSTPIPPGCLSAEFACSLRGGPTHPHSTRKAAH
ncbi:hypothetical protein WJX72_011138 [[Myrmecia] bisecta]|uniref:Uncharacterized protein n=1 Tax=[Myrmecia] bisecta TaxID=41462 RepID=A0AAW1QGI0_9CHLO